MEEGRRECLDSSTIKSHCSCQVLVDFPEKIFLHLVCALNLFPDELNGCLKIFCISLAGKQVHGALHTVILEVESPYYFIFEFFEKIAELGNLCE